ncbi:hypothetical protein PJ311_08745 [Bacillus sp. CLL-7-23]|uniref:YtxH domain-containing protein n=1 Tax=Bacillus changyiensis TaxID=3004103 RepID=A0ABT4X360_9BACI|nr:hypothetical protein [Bacillus changyiensis]MDA7026694.1 hypothetical protein [Bacillus changyiensis]
MKGNRVIIRNILLGASVGVIMSLIHKPTRKACALKIAAYTDKVRRFREQPDQLTNCIQQKIRSVSDDLSFLNQQIKELREATPEVIKRIEETRDHFSKRNRKRLE